MADSQNPNSSQNVPSPSSSSLTPSEVKNGNSNNGRNFSSRKVGYPNPPDATNPDAATLREQWKYAIRQYSRWYSHAWGTAILAGLSFFALGWIIKGSNPLPSFGTHDSSSSNKDDDKAQR